MSWKDRQGLTGPALKQGNIGKLSPCSSGKGWGIGWTCRRKFENSEWILSCVLLVVEATELPDGLVLKGFLKGDPSCSAGGPTAGRSGEESVSSRKMCKNL